MGPHPPHRPPPNAHPGRGNRFQPAVLEAMRSTYGTHCLILRRMEPIASGSGWAVTPRAHPVAMDQMGRDARLALLASRQAGAFTFQQALTKIGRASCRERVCQDG